MVSSTIGTQARQLQAEYDQLIIQIFDLAAQIEHSAFPDPEAQARLLDLQERARDIDGRRSTTRPRQAPSSI